MQKKRILITGAAGFIGSNCVRAALTKAYEVVALDAFTYAGHRQNLENLPTGFFELVEGNICDATLVQQLCEQHNFTAILNFAAESHVDRSIAGPKVFIETNIVGTSVLLEAALRHWNSAAKDPNFRFLQVSTDEVYGSLALEGEEKFCEETPLAPSSPYSASKAGADLMVQAWNHTYGLPTLITRCSNNYGPYQFPEKLIPTIIGHALAGNPLPIYGKGLNVRDWIHVEDHVHGVLLALENGLPGSVYCFGGHAELPNLELVQRLCRHLDTLQPKAVPYADQISFVTDRLGHDLRYAIDDSKAERKLGFRRKYTFETGLESTIRWYLDHTEWSKTVLAQAKIKWSAI